MRDNRSSNALVPFLAPNGEEITGSTFGLIIDGMPDLPREIDDRQGYRVDLTGPRWSVFGARVVLRVGELPIRNVSIRRATELFLVDGLKHLAPQTVANTSDRLLKLSESKSFRKADEAGKNIPGAVVREVGEAMRESGSNNFMNYEADARSWYTWCADMGFPQFDPDVATELELLVIGGNPKGLAVLSSDPNKGPLTNADFDALCVRMRNQEKIEHPDLSLYELCLVWLFIALGCNAKNLTYLCESDLVRHKDFASDEVIYTLRVPRIKKRGKVIREEFKDRKIHPSIGRLLEAMIKQNARFRAASKEWRWADNRFLRPFFLRQTPDPKWLDTDAHAFAWCWGPQVLSYQLNIAVQKLRIPTARDPKTFIKATPRRLRYTFATRLVKEGASPQAVAEALDHSDLQHVMVYFNVRNDIVNFLDRSNPKLAAVAQMFAGTLIDDESQAERGNDPKSRIYPPPATRTFEAVGNCGSMGFCNDAAPIACYTCAHFRPWKDGPHHLVFDFLADLRQRKIDAGADIKSVQIHDISIMAVARVIELCEGVNTQYATEG